MKKLFALLVLLLCICYCLSQTTTSLTQIAGEWCFHVISHNCFFKCEISLISKNRYWCPWVHMFVKQFSSLSPNISAGDGPMQNGIVTPFGLALDVSKNYLYITDNGHGRVRRADLTNGVISTVAGTGYVYSHKE